MRLESRVQRYCYRHRLVQWLGCGAIDPALHIRHSACIQFIYPLDNWPERGCLALWRTAVASNGKYRELLHSIVFFLLPKDCIKSAYLNQQQTFEGAQRSIRVLQSLCSLLRVHGDAMNTIGMGSGRDAVA